MDLSLVVITLNEESGIVRCIESVPFASEIIVVDSGSTDGTIAAAERSSARVLHHPFTDHSSQKQWALEQATSEWVLSLDADENLDPELAGRIRELIAGRPDHSAYSLPFRILYMGRLMRFGPWSGESHVRLFRRGSAVYSGSGIHEGVSITSGTVGVIRSGMVIHRSFDDLGDQVRKMREYAGIWAAGEYAAGRRSGICRCVLRPAWRFLSSYILRGGFLEGFPGLAASVVSSWYVFLKWARLLEMNRQGPAVTSDPGDTPDASQTGEGSPGT